MASLIKFWENVPYTSFLSTIYIGGFVSQGISIRYCLNTFETSKHVFLLLLTDLLICTICTVATLGKQVWALQSEFFSASKFKPTLGDKSPQNQATLCFARGLFQSWLVTLNTYYGLSERIYGVIFSIGSCWCHSIFKPIKMLQNDVNNFWNRSSNPKIMFLFCTESAHIWPAE